MSDRTHLICCMMSLSPCVRESIATVMTPKSWTVLGRFSRQRYGDGLLQPLRFEHRWRQVSQGRLEALPRIDLVQKAAKVLVGVMKVKVLMERDFLFCDGAPQALRVPMLCGLAAGRHTALAPRGLQQPDICRCRRLDAWIGVMDRRPVRPQGASQGGQGQ
jgi:hypothetical protein